MAFVVVIALAVMGTGVFAFRDYLWGVRADARAAAKALREGDLTALGEHLAEYRGEPNFAYFFTSEATPRDLGDGLATVAGPSREEPLASHVSGYVYELLLTDLAGTLGLATHGTGELDLPQSWTTDFIVATTTPTALYGEHDGFFDWDGKQREKQDVANRSNLLLLLSRGFWSLEFLQSVTEAYYDFDRLQGDKAWPAPAPSKEVGYAPSPEGAYLTDGVLALTAALTANPEASEWAFTRFLPGTTEVEGADLSIGNFTYFLMFEHRFPELDGESIGTSATLTALSSAIDSLMWVVEPPSSAAVGDFSWAEVGPMHDAAALQVLARAFTSEGKCSWSPLDYGHCVVDVAKAVLQWIQQWGHVVLDILTQLTSATWSPFLVVGVGAAVVNATWYAIEGDFAQAGLSLASAVPDLDFAKIAKVTKAGGTAVRAAARSAAVGKTALQVRAATPATAARASLSVATKAQIRAAAPKTLSGDYIDPNTGQTIPKEGPFRYGHKPGAEWHCIKAKATAEAWTREQLEDFANDPSLYQVEDHASNLSHKFEAAQCEI